MNATATKPVKVTSYKGETTYRLGDWLIYTESRTDRSYSCGLTKVTNYTVFTGHTTTGDGRTIKGSGGIKAAQVAIAKLTA
jgi:hypothetical protein